MDEIIKTENQVTIDPVVSLDDELLRINKELFVASAAREFAMYRMYRIYRDGLYKEKYEHFTEFCEEMNEQYEISRPTIYGRIKAYYSLEWMGYTAEESVKMMIERPFALSRITNDLISLTPDKQVEIKIPVEEEKSPQDTMRSIIEITDSMTMQDAALYIKENYTHEPSVKVILDGQKIVVTFTEYTANIAGESEIADFDTITFYPDKAYPQHVETYLKRLSRKA